MGRRKFGELEASIRCSPGEFGERPREEDLIECSIFPVGGRAGVESIALSRSHCQREEGGTRPDVGASSKFQSLSARERHSLPRARRHAAPPALPTALSSASN